MNARREEMLRALTAGTLSLSALVRDRDYDRAGDGPTLDALIADGLVEVRDSQIGQVWTLGWFGEPGVAIPIPIRYPERYTATLTDAGRAVAEGLS